MKLSFPINSQTLGEENLFNEGNHKVVCSATLIFENSTQDPPHILVLVIMILPESVKEKL